MLKIRTAMAYRDSLYRLEQIIEFDGTFVGGKQTGKCRKKPVLVAVETRGKRAGFMTIEAVETVLKETSPFYSILPEAWSACTKDALPALNSVNEKVTLPEEVSTWLPLVHINDRQYGKVSERYVS